MGISKLFGKIIIEANLKLLTGLHISSSSDFSAIGAVDTIVIRDPFSYEPIIPGSSLKGKMRYLLSRITADKPEISDLTDEKNELKRLFGTSSNTDKTFQSRLQFFDIRLTEMSRNKMKRMELDLPFTEIKFENSINRLSGEANPRQIERVPAGAEFAFKLVYNIENIEELKDDIRLLKEGLDILQMDYIGGHGTRGYGKIAIDSYRIDFKKYFDGIIDTDMIQDIFK